MKRVLLSVLVSLGIVLAVPLSASAISAKTDITGNVTNNGNAVKHAHVTVVCNGHQKHDQTNASGTYLVQFSAQQCPDGSTVTTAVTSKGTSGIATGAVTSETTKLNVATVNVSVPELGWIAGVAAALFGGAAFLVVRRRQLS